MGFYEKYKQDGGAATGCSLAPGPPARRAKLLWMALAAAVVLLASRQRRRGSRRQIDGLGFGHTLHVGDSTWFAGIMFDL